MSFSNQTLPYVKRHPALTALATILLVAGTAFAVKGGDSAATYIEKRTEVVTCTATGGLASYAYCNWQEPDDNAGSGSYITGLYYSIGKSPVAIRVDFTVGLSATTSGATAVSQGLTDYTTASGATKIGIGFASGSGAVALSEGEYLRAVTLADTGTGHTASMMIEYVSRLAR
jgi:hypothetical protein